MRYLATDAGFILKRKRFFPEASWPSGLCLICFFRECEKEKWQKCLYIYASNSDVIWDMRITLLKRYEIIPARRGCRIHNVICTFYGLKFDIATWISLNFSFNTRVSTLIIWKNFRKFNFDAVALHAKNDNKSILN